MTNYCVMNRKVNCKAMSCGTSVPTVGLPKPGTQLGYSTKSWVDASKKFLSVGFDVRTKSFYYYVTISNGDLLSGDRKFAHQHSAVISASRVVTRTYMKRS